MSRDPSARPTAEDSSSGNDIPWIVQQMHAEACRLKENPEGHECYWCKRTGPGLMWLPSEYGVIEMDVWQCASCVSRDHVLDLQRAVEHASRRESAGVAGAGNEVS